MSIEKRFDNFNPNCILGILVVVLSIIVPAAIAAISPIASVFVFVGSLFFPGLPIGLVNKKWRIDINNTTNQLQVSRWHDFNKKTKKVNSINFSDIKEIVAETSADGTKHRLIIIDQTSARHLLHESMNQIHANHFKDDFMQAIVLSGTSGSSTAPVRAQSTRSTTAPVVAPMLRQYAVPELSEDQGAASIDPNNRVPQDVSSALSQRGSIGDPVGSLNVVGDRVGNREEGIDSVHERLITIAKHKREVLERVFQPGKEELVGESVTSPVPVDDATGQRTDPACSCIRNTSEMFNIFDPCFASFDFIPQELAGRTADVPKVVEGETEIPVGSTPKKKNNEGEEPAINHHVDKKTEKELSVLKVRPTCMVCTIPLKGTNFICPTCETKYCIRCARTLSARKEYCWTCRKPMKL